MGFGAKIDYPGARSDCNYRFRLCDAGEYLSFSQSTPLCDACIPRVTRNHLALGFDRLQLE